MALLLASCATLSASGPSKKGVSSAAHSEVDAVPVQLVEVDDAVTRRLVSTIKPPRFSDEFGNVPPAGAIVGRGDTLDISIWEAPPAALFGALVGGGPSSPLMGASSTAQLSVARSASLPEQMVDQDGLIRVPFAGAIAAAGRTPQQIARDIVSKLAGKANDPQVIVRLAQNATSNVTVVGDVAESSRMPLTARGERLLDALASAGGVKQPVGKMTIQLTRGDHVEAMPLEYVIKDPKENVRLQADDVVTLLFQPYSFTVLGAARSNQEVTFEGRGLTLAQALGRMGGLEDQRADPRGVFIFRFEDPRVFADSQASPLPRTAEGKVPVIYRVNMKDAKTLFVAQSFPIKDRDLIYITNAPLADFSKFLQAVSQIVFPIATIQNANIF